nr:hypothetical protein [Tanacetum cinerariifolium]
MVLVENLQISLKIGIKGKGLHLCASLNVVFPFVLSNVINGLVVQTPSHTLRSPSKPGYAKYCIISGAIRVTATISPVKTESITVKLPNLLFQYDKRERRFTPTGFFDTTLFTLSKRRSNYEVLESLLRDRKRHVHNEDLRTELEYYSEEYDAERMEPRPARVREATLVLRTGSENGQPLQSTLTSMNGGNQPSTNLGGNLPSSDSTGYVTPFVRWIEEYPLSDGLKMPSHV